MRDWGSTELMDAIFLQILNGLDKGGAYALIALGLTLAFGTLGIVNFAHGALFMLGAFCAVSFNKLINLQQVVLDPTKKTAWGTPMEIRTPYVETWLGDFGSFLINYSVPMSLLLVIPFMLLVGVVMERGLIKHFYDRPHADQILVTFGLAIVLQEIVKHYFGANPIPQAAPEIVSGSANIGLWLGLGRMLFIPGGVWSIFPFRLWSLAVSLPFCNSRRLAWWCAPGCATGKPLVCWASISSSASPLFLVWQRLSPVWRGPCILLFCHRTFISAWIFSCCHLSWLWSAAWGRLAAL